LLKSALMLYITCFGISSKFIDAIDGSNTMVALCSTWATTYTSPASKAELERVARPPKKSRAKKQTLKKAAEGPRLTLHCKSRSAHDYLHAQQLLNEAITINVATAN